MDADGSVRAYRAQEADRLLRLEPRRLHGDQQRRDRHAGHGEGVAGVVDGLAVGRDDVPEVRRRPPDPATIAACRPPPTAPDLEALEASADGPGSIGV